MDAFLRAAAVYTFLVIIFRLAGRRTIAQLSSFDLVFLLLIAEASQNALIGDDYSLTTGAIVIGTLVGLDVLMLYGRQRVRWLAEGLEGLPIVLVQDGRPLRERMEWARVQDYEILAAARQGQGLERMADIKYAVLEVTGAISIIPKRA